jgi:hypothetical protein
MTHAISPRTFAASFADVPRHWMGGSVVATAISNGVNLLFPIGERFFVRSVKQFADRVTDPTLKQQIKGFFGQEGRHARAHDQFNDIMRTQGYDIDPFLAHFDKVLGWLEARVSPETNLSATAAAEHFTAIMAHGAFSQGLLDLAAPEMRALLAWHAAEEIEHKAVAYDVLQLVDPSYPTRVKGLAFASLMLGYFWLRGALTLLRQDGMTIRAARAELRAGRAQRGDTPIVQRVFLRGIRDYLRRDFHPNDTDDAALAAGWMAARGMTLPEVAA